MITSTCVMRKEAQLGQYKKIPRFNIHVFKIFFIKVGHVLSYFHFYFLFLLLCTETAHIWQITGGRSIHFFSDNLQNNILG